MARHKPTPALLNRFIYPLAPTPSTMRAFPFLGCGVGAYKHKIGASLELVGRVMLGGQAQDMSGWAPRCWCRGPMVIELDCAWLDEATGLLSVRAAPGAQAGWRPGRYGIDVELTSPASDVLISTSALVLMQLPITGALS